MTSLRITTFSFLLRFIIFVNANFKSLFYIFCLFCYSDFGHSKFENKNFNMFDRTLQPCKMRGCSSKKFCEEFWTALQIFFIVQLFTPFMTKLITFDRVSQNCFLSLKELRKIGDLLLLFWPMLDLGSVWYEMWDVEPIQDIMIDDFWWLFALMMWLSPLFCVVCESEMLFKSLSRYTASKV